MNNSNTQTWLLYCRQNFETDCAQEILRQARLQRPVIVEEQPALIKDSAYVLVTLNQPHQPDFQQLIFARQLLRVATIINPLPERDRLSPIVEAVKQLNCSFSGLRLEVADTNDGKTVSSFTRRFMPLLEEALQQQQLIQQDNALPRLHLFFPDKQSVIIAYGDPYNSSPHLMGIQRQTMPADAPSRSTLKLAEAFDTFMSASEQKRLLRPGMTAVDLGAAPGGWTYQLVKRGLRVTAIDDGPMKGSMAKHGSVQHLKQDGFKFIPRKTVDWLVCDMVEKPGKVAELMAQWLVQGYARQALFNLKLPMKQRLAETERVLQHIRSQLDQEGINYRLQAKQLYHDREEITVLISKTK